VQKTPKNLETEKKEEYNSAINFVICFIKPIFWSVSKNR